MMTSDQMRSLWLFLMKKKPNYFEHCVRNDSGFNFKVHIGKAVKKANKMLGLIRRTFKFVTYIIRSS